MKTFNTVPSANALPAWCRKTLLFTLLVAGAFATGANAQSVLVIGAGSTTTTSDGSDPVDAVGEFMHYQAVYLASELSSIPDGSLITGLGFSISEATGVTFPTYTIRLKRVSETNCATHVSVTNNYNVFNQTPYTPQVTAPGAFDVINFTGVPFIWDGTSNLNLVVDICTGDSATPTSNLGSVRADAMANGSRYIRLPSTPACGPLTTTTNGERPQIQFVYTPSTLITETRTQVGQTTMWPNPARDGQVNLKINDIHGTDRDITVNIQDVYGKQVFSKEYGNSGTRFNTMLDLPSDIVGGIYTVNITINGRSSVQRLIIIK